MSSFGTDPSTTSTNGSSSPRSAAYQWRMNSLPVSWASTGLCRCTRGMPGIAPSTTSSRLGCIAAVTATVSPSQPSPAVIHSTCTSPTASPPCRRSSPGADISSAIAFTPRSRSLTVSRGGPAARSGRPWYFLVLRLASAPSHARRSVGAAGGVGPMDERHLEVDPDLLADDPPAGLERLLPVEEPVGPVDHRRRGQDRALLGAVQLALGQPHVQRHRARDVAD